MPSDRSFVSLFSGAGGLDLGLEMVGWTPLVQIECDDAAVATLELGARHRQRKTSGSVQTRVIAAPIENVDPVELRKSLKLRKGALPLLAGGPPCQPFTTHGLRRALNDRRASAVWPTYLDYVDALAPQALLIENVDGLLSAALQHRRLLDRGRESEPMKWEERKGSFLHWLVTELTQRGYTVSWGVAEAADYGVAQMRQRAVLIGVRESSPCYLPPATHGGPGQPAFRTLRDALTGIRELGPVQPLSERKRAVYALVPPGGNWRDLPPAVQEETMGGAYYAEGGKSGWWRRLAWDRPAPTILGMPDHSSTALVHPDEVRCLSVNECAAVQSFPAETPFGGTPRAQYQQIGNAVPPLLGAALGRQISAFLDGAREDAPPAPPWRRSSANRRIGTHGWARRAKGSGTLRDVTINVQIRADHVWASEDVPKSA
ncbi:MAG TPA: DNA cytosine methyltransferase [Mycobacteriales bacterium]|nr:DNA cytosine methyltransferase [Mycobacteriales bacterium]